VFPEATDDQVNLICSMVQTLPLTVVRRQGCTVGPGTRGTLRYDPCHLDLVIAVPDLITGRRMTRATIQTHPFQRGNHWQRIDLSNFTDITFFRLSSSEWIKTRDDELQCLDSEQELACRLCSATGSLVPVRNPCLTKALTQTLEAGLCPIMPVARPEEELIVNNDNKITVIDNTPGVLEETCPDTEKQAHRLPSAASVIVTPNCQYTLNEGPEVAEIPRKPGLNLELATTTIKPAITVKTTTEATTEIEQHFQSYGYIYVMCTLVIITLFCSCACFVACRFLSKRRRKRTRRTRQLVQYLAAPTTSGNDSDLRTQLVEPQAIASIYPSMIPMKIPAWKSTARGIQIGEVV
jgi:hypothetical protein